MIPEARPRPERHLDMRTPGFHWQLRFLTFLVKTKPGDRTVTWVHEPTGNRGKTRFSAYVCRSHGGGLGANDMKSDASLWDGQRIIMVDLARSLRKVRRPTEKHRN